MQTCPLCGHDAEPVDPDDNDVFVCSDPYCGYFFVPGEEGREIHPRPLVTYD